MNNKIKILLLFFILLTSCCSTRIKYEEFKPVKSIKFLKTGDCVYIDKNSIYKVDEKGIYNDYYRIFLQDISLTKVDKDYLKFNIKSVPSLTVDNEIVILFTLAKGQKLNKNFKILDFKDVMELGLLRTNLEHIITYIIGYRPYQFYYSYTLEK